VLVVLEVLEQLQTELMVLQVHPQMEMDGLAEALVEHHQ
jgi:N-acetylglutamate synthase-like GNAT family acetyltransferase